MAKKVEGLKITNGTLYSIKVVGWSETGGLSDQIKISPGASATLPTAYPWLGDEIVCLDHPWYQSKQEVQVSPNHPFNVISGDSGVSVRYHNDELELLTHKWHQYGDN